MDIRQEEVCLVEFDVETLVDENKDEASALGTGWVCGDGCWGLLC